MTSGRTDGSRVVLYNPVSNAGGKRMLPMSLLAIGALLEERVPYTVVDGNCEANALGRLRKEIEGGADVLGVTVMPGPQLADALPICRQLKSAFPALTVVWGGYFPTQHFDAVLRDRAVDIVVRGHGEHVFTEVLDALGNGRSVEGLDGVACRSSNGRVVTGPMAPIPHPDQLPDFPYHRVDISRYLRSTFLGSRTLPHHSSYGCPFVCNFCAVVNMVQGRWLAQSADRVLSIARKYVRDFGVNAIEFYDSNFFVHEARVAEIAAGLEPLRVGWWGEARIDTLLKFSDATWRLMRESGLKMVFMGAESGSAETLKRMDKGGTLTPDKTLAIAARMKRERIIPEFSFVLGSPPDPQADIHRTLEFVRSVKAVNPASEIILYNYTPVPLAGDLYESATATGFQFPQTLDESVSESWQRFSGRYSDAMPWLTPHTRTRIRNFQRVLNAYYPTATDPRLTGLRRAALRAASAWRYRTGRYEFPIELRALHRLFRYQRPETSGF